MRDIDEFEMRPAYLLGKVEALQLALSATLAQLPEAAMRSVAQELSFESRHTREQAEETQNDIRTDYANGVYAVAAGIEAVVEEQIEVLAAGAVERTVQPYDGS